MGHLRFHLDENVDPDIAAALRKRGVDVTTTQEAGLRSAKDEPQWEYVLRERRVFVTHDAGFINRANQTPTHPGIAYCAMNSRSVGQVVEMLILMFEVYTSEEMEGSVQYL